MDCFICRKQAGLEDKPPGGYFYQEEHFLVCHAPAESSSLGTLLVESRRHFLDFEAMTPTEASAFGLLLNRLYSALRACGLGERIYEFVLLEGAPHFHTWLIPRPQGAALRGLAFLSADQSCDPQDIARLVAALEASLTPIPPPPEL